MMETAEPAATRPLMASGYGVDRDDHAGMLPWSYVTERMAAARNYWVATARPDGRPHVMPVWGLWLDGSFCFSTDPASRKARNIAGRPEIAVHLESGDDVVILEGRVEAVSDRSLLARFADAYDTKYAFRPEVDTPEPAVWRLDARVAFAWQEKDFPSSATRWSFGAG